jgi:hypothetical protein
MTAAVIVAELGELARRTVAALPKGYVEGLRHRIVWPVQPALDAELFVDAWPRPLIEDMAERQGPQARRQARLSVLRAAGWRFVPLAKMGEGFGGLRALDWHGAAWLAIPPSTLPNAPPARRFKGLRLAQMWATEVQGIAASDRPDGLPLSF